MNLKEGIYRKTGFCIVAVIFCFLFNSCSDPDHTDSVLLGSWHLETIMLNGETDISYMDNPEIMVSFQGNIFNMAYMERAEIYGSWSYAGEILTLIANYKAGSGANIGYLFNPFPVAMKFPAGIEQLEITVTAIEGGKMQWQYINDEGDLLTYNFRKYP